MSLEAAWAGRWGGRCLPGLGLWGLSAQQLASKPCKGQSRGWPAPRTNQKMPLAILSPFCFIRGRVELAPCLTFVPLPKARFFRTKS